MDAELATEPVNTMTKNWKQYDIVPVYAVDGARSNGSLGSIF